MKKLIISTATLAFISAVSISASVNRTNLFPNLKIPEQDTVDTSKNAVAGSNGEVLKKDTSSMRLPTERPGTNPTPTPTPNPSPTPTPNPTPTPAPTPTPNPSPTPTPNPTPTPAPTPNPSPTPAPNPGASSSTNPSSPRP